MASVATIIVPLIVRAGELKQPAQIFGPLKMLQHYEVLRGNRQSQFEMLLMDNSSEPDAATRLKEICAALKIPYALLPASETRKGNNKKTDAVRYALDLVSTDKIILLDEDARPTAENINRISQELDNFSLVKCIVDFATFNSFDRIDLAGIYAFNFLSRHQQNWANLAFHKAELFAKGFPPSDVLYDELAIERTLRRGNNERYINDLPIPVISGERTIWKFLKQRARWAYENMAFRYRFCFDIFVFFILLSALLAILLAPVAKFISISVILFAVLAISVVLWWAAYWYERSLVYNSAAGRVWHLAPLWYCAYPFCSVYALYRRIFRGGVPFGESENLIRKPCIRLE